jgi:protein-tyrosine phosphatase
MDDITMQSTRTSATGLFSDKQERVTDNPNNAYLVQDTDTHLAKPRNWRHPGMIIAADYQGNITGLENIKASSSAAPRAAHFRWITDQIRKISSGNVEVMYDVDLREESHAYINGEAFTHATEHNWINRGKSEKAALETENKWIREISKEILLDNVLTPDQHKNSQFSNGSSIIVNAVQSEKQVAESAGFQYIRFFISDHMAPQPHVVDQIVSFVKSLPDNAWLHLHCRGGEGRSTALLLMIDMLKNANSVSFDEIIQRHASIPPHYYFPQLTRRCKELTVYYRERLAFIQSFYDYAKELLSGHDISWSTWESRQQSVNAATCQP